MNQNDIDSDQAGFISGLFEAHLIEHGGEPDYNCMFCKSFIINEKSEYPLESYSFITLDLNENEKNNTLPTTNISN